MQILVPTWAQNLVQNWTNLVPTCTNFCFFFSEWQDLTTFGDLTLVERKDDLYYQGIVDITINDCYPDIDRKICWQYPFALLLDRTVTVCLSDEESDSNDDDCSEQEKSIAADCINYGLNFGTNGQSNCEDNPNCKLFFFFRTS